MCNDQSHFRIKANFPWIVVELTLSWGFDNLFWRESWLPLQNARTRVSLLYHVAWKRTCSDLTRQWRDFWSIFPKIVIFSIKSKYIHSNKPKKYIFNKKNVLRTEKGHFLTKKVNFYHNLLIFQTIIRINWKNVWPEYEICSG